MDKRIQNEMALKEAMRLVMAEGEDVAPRGYSIMERRNLQLRIYPQFPFNPFSARNYSVGYFKQELRWKLGASKYDESIKAHAKMWESVQNPDGSFNSNYGQYWFGQQMGLMKAVLELIRDRDSRRAVIPMLSDNHLSPETNDTVCTESITFHIRNQVLYASIHMRSSDQIFGLGTDIPTFAVLMHLAHGLLLNNYPTLQMGDMTITAASSHIYSRHFDMVERILRVGDTVIQPELPLCTPSEAMMIIADRGKPSGKEGQGVGNLYDFIYG